MRDGNQIFAAPISFKIRDIETRKKGREKNDHGQRNERDLVSFKISFQLKEKLVGIKEISCFDKKKTIYPV